METLCPMCLEKIDNFYFKYHIRNKHQFKAKEYYDKFLKKESEGVCLNCSKETAYMTLLTGYREFCCRNCANRHSWTTDSALKRKEKAKNRCKDMWQNESFRNKRSTASTNYNKRRWLEDKRYALKMKEMKKKHWENKEFRERQTVINKKTANDPKNKENLSKRMKEMWKNNAQYREKIINVIFPANYIKNNSIGPNKCEKKVFDILNEIMPNEFEFTGDGRKPICFRYPDFVNEKRKMIVEYNSKYFHRNETQEDVEKRCNLFKAAGYKTLIITESDLKNGDEARSKVFAFLL